MSEKVAKNVVSLVVSKLLSSVLVFVGYAAIFRYLGTVRTGQYQFIIAFVTLFSVVVDFGIQQYVIKKVSEHPEESEKYLGNFFATEIVVSLVIYGIMALIAVLSHYPTIVLEGILTCGFGMVLCALSDPFTAVISGHQAMFKIAFVNFADSLINVAVMFLTIIFHRSVEFLVTVQIWMGILHLIVYLRVIKSYVPKPSLWRYAKQLDFDLVRKMILAALPFGMLVGFSIVYNKIDVVILSYMKGYAETGLYTAAYKFFDTLSFFPGVVASALYPFYSDSLRKGNLEAVKNALATYTRYMISIGLPIAFGGMILAPKLMVLVGGQAFLPGYKALEILVFATAVLFSYAAVNSLVINQMTRAAVIITFINIFVNSIGNILLIPHFGFQAAAVMTLVSESIQAIVYFTIVRKKIVSFPLFSNLPKPIFCAVVMALVLWPIRDHSLAITLPIGVLAYAAMALLTGLVGRGDIDAIKRLFNRGSEIEVSIPH
jgi:O-antigen/teichoic acid export membrane protein